MSAPSITSLTFYSWECVSKEMRNCDILCLSKTWLKDNVSDSTFHIFGWQLFQADHSLLSGKKRGGGLWIYVNKVDAWSVIINRHCTNNLELLDLVKCQPFYLPRENSVMFATAVYITSNANTNIALNELQNNITSLQNKHLEALHVVAGDFNHINLIDIMLALLHCHPLSHLKPTKKTITVWPSDSYLMLQNCFKCTDWQVFKKAAGQGGELDLEESISAVLGTSASLQRMSPPPSMWHFTPTRAPGWMEK